ncbi:MAG: DUF4174 domain-containing protein [Myxococcota bacterium]
MNRLAKKTSNLKTMPHDCWCGFGGLILIGVALVLVVAGCRTEPLDTSLAPAPSPAPSSPPPAPPSSPQPMNDRRDMAPLPAEEPLAPFAWKHRPLLVFSPTLGDQRDRQLEAIAGAREGFEERDMVLVDVLASPSAASGGPAAATASPGYGVVGPAAEALRNRFQVAAKDFRVILVGKDGTEKRRDLTPVAMDPIFALIDTMPMRQREMARPKP